jgi:hypothetical protein
MYVEKERASRRRREGAEDLYIHSARTFQDGVVESLVADALPVT